MTARAQLNRLYGVAEYTREGAEVNQLKIGRSGGS